MKIVYSAHAVERMKQRNISTVEVELIIRDPDGKVKQSKDKWIYYKYIGKRKDNNIAAVTVHKENLYFEVLAVMINFEVRK